MLVGVIVCRRRRHSKEPDPRTHIPAFLTFLIRKRQETQISSCSDGRHLAEVDLSRPHDVMDHSQFSAVGQIARLRDHRTMAAEALEVKSAMHDNQAQDGDRDP